MSFCISSGSFFVPPTILSCTLWISLPDYYYYSLHMIASVLRCGISTIFLVGGIAHFVPKYATVMSKIIPPYIADRSPLTRMQLVYFTGVCELAGAIGIQLAPTCTLAGILLSVFMVCILPANIYAAQYPERFPSVSIPLWKRIPAQIILIAITLYVTVLSPVA